VNDSYRIELDLPNGHVAAEGDAATVSVILRASLTCLERGIEAPAPVARKRVRTRDTSRNPDSVLQSALQDWLLATLPATKDAARDIPSLVTAAPVKASRASVSDALAHLIEKKKVDRARVGMRFHYYLAGVDPQATVDDFAATIVAGEGVTKGSV
jgi:16S rRNA G1207 methylase RsmC